jgi:hypothetical protein
MHQLSRLLLSGLVALSLTIAATAAHASWSASIVDVMNLVYCIIGTESCEGLEPGADLVDITSNDAEVIAAAMPACDFEGGELWDGSSCATPEVCAPVCEGTINDITGACIPADYCGAQPLDPWWNADEVVIELHIGCHRAVVAYTGIGNPSTTSWCGNCDEYDNETVRIEFNGVIYTNVQSHDGHEHASFAWGDNPGHHFSFDASSPDYTFSFIEPELSAGSRIMTNFIVSFDDLADGKVHSLADISGYDFVTAELSLENCDDIVVTEDPFMGEMQMCNYTIFEGDVTTSILQSP